MRTKQCCDDSVKMLPWRQERYRNLRQAPGSWGDACSVRLDVKKASSYPKCAVLNSPPVRAAGKRLLGWRSVHVKGCMMFTGREADTAFINCMQALYDSPAL